MTTKHVRPRVICVASQKGGQGKSAVTTNLATALAIQGHRVLVADLDGQGNTSTWLGYREENRNLAESLVEEAALEPVELPIFQDSPGGVDLIPSSGAWLDKSARILSGEAGGELVFKVRLGELLDRTPGRWDLVLLDTAPQVAALLTLSGLCAADDLLSPVESSSVALSGLVGLLDNLEPIRARLAPDLSLLGILLSRMDRTVLAREIEAALRERFGDTVLTSVVRDRVAVRESWGHAKPVAFYSPDSDAAEDYARAALELGIRCSLSSVSSTSSKEGKGTQAATAGEEG